MSDIAIKVQGLGKRYRIGQTAGYKTLRDSLTNAVTAPFRRGARGAAANGDSEHIWALKDVSFEIKRGEAVGIIGKNGSGKSTLLKILSRITAPTEGYAEIRGRASSLLEVGTGFHPELTGRENIYLNGAVLGMKKADTDRRLDEIVAFSEIGQFLDTPVKRYSSGMYVRLAFAVAAHLEPDILLVDEVLAVGDAQFQKKCLGKMDDVTKEGRTVVFVSHNLIAVTLLCEEAMLLERGHLVDIGKTQSVVTDYLSPIRGLAEGEVDLTPKHLRKNSSDTSAFKWTHVRIENSKGETTRFIRFAEPFRVVLKGILSDSSSEVLVGLGVTSQLGFPLFSTHSNDARLPTRYSAGTLEFSVSFDTNILGPGLYVMDLGARGESINDWIPEAITMEVGAAPTDDGGLSRLSHDGVVVYPCKWRINGG